ncbi:hypothetical protein BLNAU_11652 [Blattamonas nauphoetae]|uniref:Uncharacterized protein n=1 Tax=Blattamonas nauphoetae TaxID=2049346 RepID=A0ABQ9XRH6_9EUKA|nr:hypothetical protein BLNAU_11652 [Blattamonas nauphoetae]
MTKKRELYLHRRRRILHQQTPSPEPTPSVVPSETPSRPESTFASADAFKGIEMDVSKIMEQSGSGCCGRARHAFEQAARLSDILSCSMGVSPIHSAVSISHIRTDSLVDKTDILWKVLTILPLSLRQQEHSRCFRRSCHGIYFIHSTIPMNRRIAFPSYAVIETIRSSSSTDMMAEGQHYYLFCPPQRVLERISRH